MRRLLASLLAAVTLAVSLGGLAAAGPDGSEPLPSAADLGPHYMLPNPDVYPEIPFRQAPWWTGTPPGTRSGGTRATGIDSVIVVLIEFTDVPGSRPPGDIDLLMNDASPNAASVANYFDEVSYGIFGMTGTVTAWVRSSRTMAQYGADSSPSTFDDANGPIYRLVVEAVRLVDPMVDFRQFDGDGNGVVDHIIVVHSGDAQEANGNNPDLIWSHRWAVIDGDSTLPGDQRLVADGVQIYGYIMVSKSSPVGVYVHELGHDLGLPDLYDTDGSSEGVGAWDVMGTGSWNGVPRGTMPAHMGAWAKMKVGWLNPIEVTSPLLSQVIDQAETNPQAFKLPVRTIGSVEEYFLVENRQRVGFDTALPGHGLLIWHIDESVQGNQDDTHRLVDLEEADGNDRPTQATDPWKDCRECFSPDSTPNSNSYLNQRTGWKVRNIGPSGPVMTADLSREVDDDVMIAAILRPCCTPVGGTVPVDVTVGNRGARAQQDLVVNLTVYRNAYDPASAVCCGGKTVASLASGATVDLRWDVPVAASGKYILEASVELSLDEIPENNMMFAHFNAAAYFLLDHVVGDLGWTRNGGANDPAAWSIVQDGNVSVSRSPPQAWRFGRTGSPPLCAPLCPEFYTLTSPTLNVPAGAPAYLYFWHRRDLTGRGIDLFTGDLETDVGFVNVSVDGTWRSVGRFTGVDLAWNAFQANLTPFLTGPAQVTIEFSASAEVLRDDGGWWVDDIALATAPLGPGLVARAVNGEASAEPGGVAMFRFKVANVGDFDEDVAFALQPPTGWVAAIGHNQTRMQPYDMFSVRLRPDAEATLLLAFQIAPDTARGSRWTVPVTGASRTNASVASTFDTVTVISDPFGLAGLERYVIVFLIVFAVVIVIAVVIDAVKKQKGVYRRW